MPISRQVRITRTAISPRLAIRTFCNTRILRRGPVIFYHSPRKTLMFTLDLNRLARRTLRRDRLDEYLAGQTRAAEGARRSGRRRRLSDAGRGRLDRRWESPAGSSLLCSILLRPDVGPDQLQLVVACVALGARGPRATQWACGRASSGRTTLIVGDAKSLVYSPRSWPSTNELRCRRGIGVNLTYDGPRRRRDLRARRVGLTIAPPRAARHPSGRD